MISLDFSKVNLRLKQENSKTLVFDPVRRKWLVLTPEEHVRQYMLYYLTGTMAYPPALVAVERKILTGKMAKRFDIVVYDRNHRPWMLIECKAPEIPVTDKTLHQLLQYQQSIQCPYWVLTNGHQTFCANATDISNIIWTDTLPVY